MVVCKFYRQGNCRYGQYCQFEHINNFAGGIKDFNNEDEIVVAVAKEVLLAERGGQWLLSCFAPIKERPIIPGMDDLSPEEIRWEIYQAQKSGMVEQAKLHFQQLCRDMKGKRDALKNPNRETITILKKLLGGQKGRLNGGGDTAGKSPRFSLSAPQLGLANTTPANNIFGKQTFGVQSNNLFGGGFSSTTNASIFGKSNTNTTPLFGGTPTFGNNLGFTTVSNTNPIFGSATTNAPATFSNVQSTPAFGAVAPQTSSIFGGSSQNAFGQSNIFGGTNQLTSQSTATAFDNPSTSSISLFNSPITSPANTSLFVGTQSTTANLFGSSPSTSTNSIFGATTSSSPFNAGIFSQSKTLPAFGGAPVFGGVTNYANNPSSIFGATTQTFGTPAISIGNIFGSTATTTPAFGTSVVTTAPAFGVSVATTASNFGGNAAITTPAFALGQQPVVNAFGTTISAPNVFGTQTADAAMSASNSTFGGSTATISNPFVTASSQFGSTNTTSTPFSNAGFGLTAARTSDTFGNVSTSSNSVFANTGTTFPSSNVIVPNPSPFATPTFGNLNVASSLNATNTNIATTAINPFAPRTENVPFGNIAPNNVIRTSPYDTLPFTLTVTSTVINDSIYTAEGSLTDDEKNIYLAEKFIIGKIPLKPPTKDIK